MSKQSRAPTSDFWSNAFALSSRWRRRRSKSTRFSQSTAIVPYVGRATVTSLISLPAAAEFHRRLKDGLFGRYSHVFQRWRKGNRHVHRAYPLNGRVETVECAARDDRRNFSGYTIPLVAFVEHDDA